METLTEEELKMRMVVDRLTLDLYTPEIRRAAREITCDTNWFLHCFKLFVRELIKIEAELSQEENVNPKKSTQAFKEIIEEIIDYKGIQGFFDIITALDLDKKIDNYDEMRRQIKNVLKEGLS